jgi:hypothetical protein
MKSYQSRERSPRTVAHYIQLDIAMGDHDIELIIALIMDISAAQLDGGMGAR